MNLNQDDIVEELYERIYQLKSELYLMKDIDEFVRNMLLHSSISLKDCENIFYFLTMNDRQEYKPSNRKTETELFRVLEMI